VWVGPFADGDLFRESGNETVRSIVELCGLDSDARVLEVGCGCGRVAAALLLTSQKKLVTMASTSPRR